MTWRRELCHFSTGRNKWILTQNRWSVKCLKPLKETVGAFMTAKSLYSCIVLEHVKRYSHGYDWNTCFRCKGVIILAYFKSQLNLHKKKLQAQVKVKQHGTVFNLIDQPGQPKWQRHIESNKETVFPLNNLSTPYQSQLYFPIVKCPALSQFFNNQI